METKIPVKKGKDLATKWRFSKCEGVDSVGLSGGLLIMWGQSVKVHVSVIKKNIICVYLSDPDNNFLDFLCIWAP